MRRKSFTQVPPTKHGGGVLSIRFLAALMSAILIILNTTAALVITFQLSLSSTNKVASTHAAEIASKARNDVVNFINHPLSIIRGWQYTYSKRERVLPKDEEFQDPLWYKTYRDTFAGAMRGSDFKYTTLGLMFDDSSSIYCSNSGAIQFVCRYIRWKNTSVTEGGKGYRILETFNRSDFSLVSEKTHKVTPVLGARYHSIPHKPGTIMWSRVFLSGDSLVPTVAVSAVVFNESDIMLGIISIAFTLSDLKDFIDAIITTKDSVSVIVDKSGVLLASSHSIPYTKSTIIPITYNETLPYNCLKSRKKGEDHSRLVCRETYNSYPYPPLLQLKLSNPEIIDDSTNNESRIMTLDGTDYFIAVGKITPVSGGINWRIILFLPFDDIIIGIVKGRNIAIIISLTVIVFAVIVSYVSVTLLLRPLNSVVEDMYRVASMQVTEDVSGDLSPTPGADGAVQDTNNETEPSLFSEIANLQIAFKAMRTEISKLKSYLPQSVLAQLYGDYNFSDEEKTDHETIQPHYLLGAESCSYSLDTKSDTTNLTEISHGHSKSMDTRSLTLSHRNVTIISLNISSYNDIQRSKNYPRIAQIQSELVTTILSACSEHHGVIDGFQGDRFLASFNAVTSVGNHSIQAAHAAQAACMAAKVMYVPLVMTVGLASGPAIMGNMGSATVKRFTILGHVVSTAATLERLGKRYLISSGVLASGAAITHLETIFDVLTVDAAVLPICTAGDRWRECIVVVMSPKLSDPDEWMFEDDGVVGEISFNDANLAFSAFLEGNHAEASRIVELILDGEHDPYSISVGKRLKNLMDVEPAIDGKRYVSPMTDYYVQCVLPKGANYPPT